MKTKEFACEGISSAVSSCFDLFLVDEAIVVLHLLSFSRGSPVSGSQFLHNQFPVYRFDFAFVNLANPSLSLLGPERIYSLLIRAIEARKQMVSQHRAHARWQRKGCF
jgi:hypothetical protein